MLALAASWCVVPATAAHADGSYTETVGGSTHTWTNYTNAGGAEGATIAPHQSIQVQCWVTGFAVSNGNTYWYQLASPPWNDQYYASSDAFYNNGATSGSLRGTPFVDPAVPQCGSAPSAPQPPAPPQTANPSISLSQGPSAPHGYRYAISLSGFAGNSAVVVRCSDSQSSDFYTFTMHTNGSGSASTDHQCYSNDGPDHWVNANGVESNHVQWQSRSSANGNSAHAPGGTSGTTNDQGNAAPKPQSLKTICDEPSNYVSISDAGDALVIRLFTHYLDGTGLPVVIGWNNFSGISGLKAAALPLGVGGQTQYSPSKLSSLEYVVGTFTLCKLANGSYGAYDHYDFRPDKIANIPYFPYWLLSKVHGAAEFATYASGTF